VRRLHALHARPLRPAPEQKRRLPAPRSDAGAADGAAPAPRKRSWSLLPPTDTWELARSSWQLLRQHLWALLAVYAIKDGLAFLLHRVSHRLTNAGGRGRRGAVDAAAHAGARAHVPVPALARRKTGPGLLRAETPAQSAQLPTPSLTRAAHQPGSPAAAEQLLGLPVSAAANPWWLVLDPSFLDSNFGAPPRPAARAAVACLAAVLAALPACLPACLAVWLSGRRCCVGPRRLLPRPCPPPCRLPDLHRLLLPHLPAFQHSAERSSLHGCGHALHGQPAAAAAAGASSGSSSSRRQGRGS
jgi:hypothetical protein